MDDPNLTIKCLRCAKTAELSAQSARKENGEWKPVNAQRPEGWVQGPAIAVSEGLCPDCAEKWKDAQKEFLTPLREIVKKEPARLLMMKAAASIESIPVRSGAFVDTTIPYDAPQGLKTFGSPVQARNISAPSLAPQVGQARIVPTAFPAQSLQAKPIIPVIQKAEPLAVFKPLPGIADRVVSTPTKIVVDAGPQPESDLPKVEISISTSVPGFANSFTP